MDSDTKMLIVVGILFAIFCVVLPLAMRKKKAPGPEAGDDQP